MISEDLFKEALDDTRKEYILDKDPGDYEYTYGDVCREVLDALSHVEKYVKEFETK
jgi:hypothetical protein